jgi:replicative DNA helicase
MSLGGGIEDNTLTGLCWNDNIAPQIALKVKPPDFSTQVYRRIAEVAFDFLQRHNRCARIHLYDILEDDIKRGNDGRFMYEVLREMETRMAPELNEAFVLSELDKFLAIQHLTKAVNQASDHLQNGQLAEAQEILRKPDLLPHDVPGIWLRDTDRWLSFMTEEEDVELFSCGIDILDERGVRPQRGELFVLLAASGMGKSWFLINAGKLNVLGGRKNVLHITLENSLDVTTQRYTQSFLSLTSNESKSILVRIFDRPGGDAAAARLDKDNPAFDSIRGLSRIALAQRLKPYQGRGQLLVKHFPTGSLTIGMLVAYMDALERVEHFTPDLVILDYMTLMRVDPRELRASIGQLARDLRGLASMRNFALLTVAQGNRLSRTASIVTSGNTAEDWSIVQTSDTFITYSQTQSMRQLGVANILVEKARNARDKWMAMVTQAYEIGQFCLDSNFMTDDLRKALQAAEEAETER